MRKSREGGDGDDDNDGDGDGDSRDELIVNNRSFQSSKLY